MSDTTEKLNETEGSDDSHPLLWGTVALLAFVLIAVAGYKYREQQRETVIATAPLDAECLLNQQACRSTLPDFGSVTISIEPKQIIASVPMQLSLQLQGIEASTVMVDFRGESMNMGLNQYRLLHDKAGDYNAEVVLPVCVRNSMFWIADVVITTSRGTLIAPFRFESVHP